MKKNVRNALAISGLALAIGASGFTLEASANMGTNGRIQRSHQERIVRTRKASLEKNIVGHRLVVGAVSSIGDNSLTVTRGAKTFTINIASDTRLLNRSWKAIAFSDIQTGNKIRVAGTISGTTLTAKTIRDISLPTPLK
ncbi:MAG: hypothetical protein PHW24_03075 [Candidatus Moranbacteria bacterium]|nr:hypothetical protein [Candidatus Moranbacteria bacterium]